MKKNNVKHALSNNIQTFGSWVTLSNPLIPEIMSEANFDWLCIDMEHSSLELSDILNLIISIENNDMIPLVRVGENNANLIKRVMDAGAYGVIIPNVTSTDEVKDAINAVKYPLEGTRGVGLYRAQKYGKSFNEYLKWLKNESIVIIQIEHIDAVNNIDEIFSIPGIDGFMIGPYDLSGSLGKPGELEHPLVNDAINVVLKAGEKHNITAGYHVVNSDPDAALIYQNKGFKFLGISLDSILLGDAAISAMSKVSK
jgi:2-dehydro-3-deoxyglucarate aldolase